MNISVEMNDGRWIDLSTPHIHNEEDVCAYIVEELLRRGESTAQIKQVIAN